jgi:hypothetical protein
LTAAANPTAAFKSYDADMMEWDQDEDDPVQTVNVVGF